MIILEYFKIESYYTSIKVGFIIICVVNLATDDNIILFDLHRSHNSFSNTDVFVVDE